MNETGSCGANHIGNQSIARNRLLHLPQSILRFPLIFSAVGATTQKHLRQSAVVRLAVAGEIIGRFSANPRKPRCTGRITLSVDYAS